MNGIRLSISITGAYHKGIQLNANDFRAWNGLALIQEKLANIYVAIGYAKKFVFHWLRQHG